MKSFLFANVPLSVVHFVSGVRVRPEGPKEQGDALRACSNMRGDRFFRVGASRLTRMPASVVARDSPAPKASGCPSAKREPRRGRKGPSAKRRGTTTIVS